MADIKLKDLRYLVAVADTGHFGKAAARCFVSQPTLSAQLRKLEEYLGVELVERQPRQALLTPAGVEVVARARLIVEASDEVVEIARSWIGTPQLVAMSRSANLASSSLASPPSPPWPQFTASAAADCRPSRTSPHGRGRRRPGRCPRGPAGR